MSLKCRERKPIGRAWNHKTFSRVCNCLSVKEFPLCGPTTSQVNNCDSMTPRIVGKKTVVMKNWFKRVYITVCKCHGNTFSGFTCEPLECTKKSEQLTSGENISLELEGEKLKETSGCVPLPWCHAPDREMLEEHKGRQSRCQNDKSYKLHEHNDHIY